MKNRNQIVDVFKIIAALFVIFLHFPFPGYLGKIVFSIARFAVPFFFIVSGYYYSKEDKGVQLSRTGSKIQHIILLLLVAEFVRFVQCLLNNYDSQCSFSSNAKSVIIERLSDYRSEIWRAISFTPLFSYSAWFLVQLIAVYILYAVITRYKLFRVSKNIFLTCFVFGFFLIRICNLMSIDLPPYSDYFILFMGVPFFSFGYYLKEYSYIPKAKTPVLAGLLLSGAILSVLESVVISTADVFFGSLIIDFALTALFIRFADVSMKTIIGQLLSFLGNKICLYVYILHSFVGSYVIAVFNKIFGANTLLKYFLPLLIFLFTLIFSAIIYKINSIIGKKRREWKTRVGTKY